MKTEAEKIRPRVRPLMEGKTVVDLGCGAETIVPWAQGVDDASESRHPAENCVRESVVPSEIPLSKRLGGRRFDIVFSSHTVEHLPNPVIQTLRYWTELLLPGGLFIAYLPDEGRYQYDPSNRRRRNPAHHHFLVPETFLWYLEQIPELTVEVLERDPDLPDRYSFLVIARKVKP